VRARYTQRVKKLLPLLLLAAGAACSSFGKPVFIEDRPAQPARASTSEEEEARARQRIREIEDRIARGDLPKIQFEFDKADIMSASYQTLDRVAEVILSSERLKLMIFAHTDNVGADGYNLDLSRRRAEAVKSYLAGKGAPPPSMRSRGYGAAKPIADNSTEEGRAKNRRVEFYVTTREWNAVY
jgi:outer membrane protein OmpA-like peptidoglycan-associated protein